jgi:glycosyltransferase involved in cell wall biosynthesis
MSIIYFVDNKLGGVSSLNYNLVNYCPEGTACQWVIHIDAKEDKMARAGLEYPADRNIPFDYSFKDNIYGVLRDLRKLLPEQPGALVVNYRLEMEMLDHFPVRQTVFQLVHDGYNLELAERYGHVVDVFIAHNSYIFDSLVAKMPARRNAIFYLPNGVPVPDFSRRSYNGPYASPPPLKLLFLGRINRQKGIYDLPVIGRLLRAKGVPVEWTCIGRGPEEEAFRSEWSPADKVTFAAPADNSEVLRICSEQDVFVLPTKFEGSPVSLLETMSVGLVPVISDLPGGIREVVDDDTGYRIAVDDNEEFAAAISKLHEDRGRLETLSRNCRERIVTHYDIRARSAAYHSLFDKYAEFYCLKKLKRLKVGARLDQPWLPSMITRSLRSLIKK